MKTRQASQGAQENVIKLTWALLAGAVLLLAGCATQPDQLCPKPGEFTDHARGKNYLMGSYIQTFHARKVVVDGQIKSIVLDDAWYGLKRAEYQVDLPEGSKDVAFRIDEFKSWLSYLTPQNTRVLEEWRLAPVTDHLSFFAAPAKYVLYREWQKQTNGTWALTFKFSSGSLGYGVKVKREAHAVSGAAAIP